MAFTTFTSLMEAARCLQDFLYDREVALPDDVREKLRDLISPAVSPVDTVAGAAELMYARKDELPDGAKEIAAGLALLAEQFNFHQMAVDKRGSKIALAFMREAKVKKPTGVNYPKKADDPEPKKEHVKVTVEDSVSA